MYFDLLEREYLMFLLTKDFEEVQSAWADGDWPEMVIDYYNSIIQGIVKKINDFDEYEKGLDKEK